MAPTVPTPSQRAGSYRPQPAGHRAFIPAPLPPEAPGESMRKVAPRLGVSAETFLGHDFPF
jgi:hypothetical protein